MPGCMAVEKQYQFCLNRPQTCSGQETFEKLNGKWLITLLLAYADIFEPFRLCADASSGGPRALLAQAQDSQEMIEYASQTSPLKTMTKMIGQLSI